MPSEWNGVAAAYARSFAHVCAGAAAAVADRVATTDRATGRAVDAGTGTGAVAAELVERGFAVTAFDSDPSMVAWTAERHPEVDARPGALPHLPLADGTADAATASFVLNHVPDPRAAVAELARVVRPGGAVAVSIWPAEPVSTMNGLWNATMAGAGVAPVRHPLPPELDFERSAAGLARLLEDALIEVEMRQLEWDVEIAPDELWAAAEGGVATIGATFRATSDAERHAMRAAYVRLAADLAIEGRLHLPSAALIGSGRTPGPAA